MDSTSNATATAYLDCDKMKKNLLNAGHFVKKGDSSTAIQRFFNTVKFPQDGQEKPYGSTLGLNKLKKLIDKIEAYNYKQGDEEDTIKAIRLYQAISIGTPDTEHTPADAFFYDVVIVPVLANGKDIIDLKKMDEEDPLIGRLRPCPNECEKSFFY